MHSLTILVSSAITIVIWVLIIQAILSWLLVFNVINRYNQFVATFSEISYRLTNPLLRPIRRIVPYIAGIDLSPMILILILYFLKNLLWEYSYLWIS